MAYCRDCPYDSASCRDSRQEAKSHGRSLQEAVSRARKSRQESRESRTVSAEAKYDGQSLQEAKIGGLVYTLWALRKVVLICRYRRIGYTFKCSECLSTMVAQVISFYFSKYFMLLVFFFMSRTL